MKGLIDTLTLQIKVNPIKKVLLYNDFKNGIISNVHPKWKKRILHYPTNSTRFKLYGKRIITPLNYDRYYFKKYEFVGGIGGYTIYYAHYKYRNDYLFVTLQNKIIQNKENEQIYNDTLVFLNSIGVDTDLLILDENLNRIDFKRDAKASSNLEIEAFFNAISKARNSFYGIDKINYTSAVKYKPKGSSMEIIVYNKEAEMNARHKKRSHVDLELVYYKGVIRTELRLKSKKLYNNSKNKNQLPKKMSSYFDEEVIDKMFHQFVEPIFYSEDIYRLDFATIKIINSGLKKRDIKNLCHLISEINRKGFSEAKLDYNFCDDTFDKHIKLLRSIGVNPLTFDVKFDIGKIPNFTLKQYCRDFSNK